MPARVAKEEEKERFNAFASASPYADFMQSWEWGEVKRRSGWAPRRFLVEDDAGRVLGTASVLARRPAKPAPPLLYAPRGPVVEDFKREVLDELIGEIRARSAGAFMLKCDPPIEGGSTEAQAMTAAGFTMADTGGFGGVQPKAVMVLDLAPDTEKILAGFRSKWRYNVRLAERKGVEVSRATRDDLPAFYELLVDTAKRDGFFIRGRRYFEDLFDILEPANMMAMFLTRHEGKPIAGAICLGFGQRLTYVYGASSNEHRNVMPNHLMQWHMIRWAKENGYGIYDFRGVSPVRDGKPVEEDLAGLNRFKEGFGARYVEYAGTFDLPLKPLMYRAWVWGYPVAMSALKRLKRGRAAAADDA
jgi:lipid II:glycine glycyltransferase (peptidoglycan interpeptide bridge formation enzyme)